MALPSAGNCISCGKNTAKHCTRCAEGAGIDGNRLSSTFYCSKECQQADFVKHKASCRIASDRQQLYRGGAILQQALYAIREITFDKDISKVKFEDKKLHVFLNYYERDGDLLFRFPDHLVSNQDDKKAILTHLACSDALVNLSELAAKVFGAITSSKTHPEEAIIDKKDMPKTIELYHGNGLTDKNQYYHQFFTVTLKNGETYAIDPAGAQFRQYRAVMPLTIYENAYVAKYMSRGMKLGHAATELEKVLNLQRQMLLASRVEGFCDQRILTVQKEITKAMRIAVKTWETNAGKTVSAMLKEKEAVFESDKNELLATIEKQMLRSLNGWKPNMTKSTR